MPELLSIENAIALLTLTAMEVVLGIDNIVFLSIVVDKLDPSIRAKARFVGLALAMIMRILLLLTISWIVKLTNPWFTLFAHEVSPKDLILLAGGLFLIGKATFEIHDKMNPPKAVQGKSQVLRSFQSALIQIVILDLVFSLDSVITAVGMARHIAVMVSAVIIAVAVMMVFAGSVSRFVTEHPTIKVLGLAFLLLIGVMLVAEGCGRHIEKGYIYFAMAFALGVEFVNMRVRKIDAPPAQVAAGNGG